MLWAGKWLIVGITSAVTVIAIVIALMLPNIYRAEALLAPNDQDGAGGLSALAAQYGDLASLTGINIGGNSTDKTTAGLEILKSRKFLYDFIERHDILVPLVADRRWNPETGELIIDSDDYDVTANKWVRKVSPPKRTIPSLQEAYEEFREILHINKSLETGYIIVSVEHVSPTIAKQWVDWLVEDINSTILEQDVREANQAMEYLTTQISLTSLAELRSVFYGLIEDQMRTVVLAKASLEYVLRTLDPAVVPEKKAKPNRILIVILSAFLGGLIGIGVQLFRVPNDFTKRN